MTTISYISQVISPIWHKCRCIYWNKTYCMLFKGWWTHGTLHWIQFSLPHRVGLLVYIQDGTEFQEPCITLKYKLLNNKMTEAF